MCETGYEEAIKRQNKKRYEKVFCSLFSNLEGDNNKKGDFLFCASSTGRIYTWNLKKTLQKRFLALSSEARQTIAAEYSFLAHEKKATKIGSEGTSDGVPIYALQFHEKLLFSGGDDCIKIWDWGRFQEDVKGQEHEVFTKDGFRTNKRGNTKLPLRRELKTSLIGLKSSSLGNIYNETTSLCVDDQGKLYSACGDGAVYEWDTETGQAVSLFSEHLSSVSCLNYRHSSRTLISASLDASIRVWDVRTKRSVSVLEAPSSPSDSSSSLFPKSSSNQKRKLTTTDGRSICSLKLDSSEDWVTCGLSSGVVCTWHFPSQVLTSTFSTDNSISDLSLDSENIVVCGQDNCIQEFKRNGTPQKSSKAHLSSILYSIDVHPALNQNTIYAVSGNSPYVDLFLPSSYQSFTLFCY
eukprot:TRINITY_DN3525_c0_g2_i1.p1 TRINITY_DN3525_c0_g2~~TRINITY_DN3525_c0_g2_i1.p1  ORF type:complete len:426 (+),score=75.55 TRINITY_DN3525_c0_g2_i1:52-1278(+)